MGFWDSLGSTLLGGLGRSTSPGDYAVANPQQQQLNNLMGQQAAQVDPSQQAQFRALQMQQAQQLQRLASGQAQGAGELAAQRQMQNAIAAQQAQARMARGGNSALAYRNAANNSAGLGLAGAGQSQQAALQDQQNAQNALLSSLNQGRSGDINIGTTNAQLAQNQYGQNLGALTNLNGQQLQAQQQAMAAALGQQGILGGLLNAGGTVAAAAMNPAAATASDRKLKTDIKEDAGVDVDEMLDRLQAKRFRYKDQKYGAGERVGVMAQDLERSRAGARVVRHEPDGRKLDPGAAISAALAAAARLHERVKKLEGRDS